MKASALAKMLDTIINQHQFDSATYERLAEREPTWFNTICNGCGGSPGVETA